MGSISTVSSQTFKTYCFRAEKKKKIKEKERRRRRKRADEVPVMSRSGGENKREGMGRNGEFGTQIVEKWRWGQSFGGDEAWRERWGWKKEEIVEGRKEERRKERSCECPRGERESGHPSLLWPAAVLPATTSHSHHILTASFKYACRHSLLAIQQQLALKINSIMYQAPLYWEPLHSDYRSHIWPKKCIYNRWCPYMELHLMEDVLLLIHDKKKKKRSLFTGRKTTALDGIDVCDFDNVDFIVLLYYL